MTEQYTPEQIDGLRDTAKNLGCRVGNLRDVEKLQAMVDEKLAEQSEVRDAATARRSARKENYQKAMKLRRVRVTPMSPYYKQMNGAYFTAGNSVVGNVTRFIQFNEVWHCEEILLNMLLGKRYRSKLEKKDPQTRRTVYENKFYNAFAVEILPDLTKEELKELADDQRARHAID